MTQCSRKPPVEALLSPGPRPPRRAGQPPARPRRLLERLSRLTHHRVHLRSYVSSSIQNYRFTFGKGLPAKSPLDFLTRERAGAAAEDAILRLPSVLGGGGGTRPDEMAYLAAVTRLLQPRVVFEIGTFTGLTTCAFVMNAPGDARVITLDLPPDVSAEQLAEAEFIEGDRELVDERRVGLYLKRFHLDGRCTQLLCDSMELDPTPYRDLVDLGFIDGAHALPFVVNDTEKMAVMISDDGLVFWHDYGGMGEFRPLTSYLEGLAKRAPLYQVPFTTLAWTTGSDLKAALAAA